MFSRSTKAPTNRCWRTLRNAQIETHKPDHRLHLVQPSLHNKTYFLCIWHTFLISLLGSRWCKRLPIIVTSSIFTRGNFTGNYWEAFRCLQRNARSNGFLWLGQQKHVAISVIKKFGGSRGISKKSLRACLRKEITSISLESDLKAVSICTSIKLTFVAIDCTIPHCVTRTTTAVEGSNRTFSCNGTGYTDRFFGLDIELEYRRPTYASGNWLIDIALNLWCWQCTWHTNYFTSFARNTLYSLCGSLGGKDEKKKLSFYDIFWLREFCTNMPLTLFPLKRSVFDLAALKQWRCGASTIVCFHILT